MFPPLAFNIPTNWHTRYRILRVLLYIFVAILSVTFLVRALFPTIEQTFDFRTPGSSRNHITHPRSQDNTPAPNGKVATNGALIANTAVAGDFSQARLTLTLEKKSSLPDGFVFSLRRSYQSFLYPTGATLSTFPDTGALYLENGVYYALKDGTLFPFVSEQAFLSRYPANQADTTAAPQVLEWYPLSETWLGFRVGSLISNGGGVFVVVSDTEIRPLGSAEVFLALGYNFADVLPVSEEEIGIYKRGRIFLLGDPHPDGTLFRDQDTDTFFLIEQGMKRPLAGAYLDFMRTHTHPIVASSVASRETVDCQLLQGTFSLRSFTCSVPLGVLSDNPGNEYELTLDHMNTPVDIRTLSLAFSTDKNTRNLLTLLSQMKHRLLSRFGYGNPE